VGVVGSHLLFAVRPDWAETHNLIFGNTFACFSGMADDSRTKV